MLSYTKSMQSRRQATIWSPTAAKDVRDIWRYFVRVASLEFADAFILNIAKVAEQLAVDTYVGRERIEFGVGTRSIPIHPYTLFYQVSEPAEVSIAVEILRVVHERRNLKNLPIRE